MKKLGLREWKQLTQSHTPSKWVSKVLNPDVLTSRSNLFENSLKLIQVGIQVNLRNISLSIANCVALGELSALSLLSHL